MHTQLTALFSTISDQDEAITRLNALMHVTFDHISGGALDEPDLDVVSSVLLMAREQLDIIKQQNDQLTEAYRALKLETSFDLPGKGLAVTSKRQRGAARPAIASSGQALALAN